MMLKQIFIMTLVFFTNFAYAERTNKTEAAKTEHRPLEEGRVYHEKDREIHAIEDAAKEKK